MSEVKITSLKDLINLDCNNFFEILDNVAKALISIRALKEELDKHTEKDYKCDDEVCLIYSKDDSPNIILTLKIPATDSLPEEEIDLGELFKIGGCWACGRE